nr:isopentenyl-diphosphate Delta-isomerase [uncultured Pedobacter sp.]
MMIEKPEHEESVILVDEHDNVIGTMPKMEAHLAGKLHRAFSVFIFNTNGELLLQRRAEDKYHSGGQWTNTCCSHPRLGEETLNAANRRLNEEMGMECKLEYGFNFTYHAELTSGISENEYDHVFFGISDQVPNPNPEEVSEFRYVNMADLEEDIKARPEIYTEWLKICFDRIIEYYNRYLFKKP